MRNLIEGLRGEGLRVSVVRAPAFCRKLPRSVLYLFAVVVEQALLPAIGFWQRAHLTIYPYNSVAVIDLLTRRGRIVVHDLEQLNRPLSFSKLYYLFCYRTVKWFNAPLFTISEITRQRLAQSGLFGNGPVTLLPNTFYALSASPLPRRRGAAIDLAVHRLNREQGPGNGLAEYLPAVLAQGFRVSILGLHKASDMAKLEPVAAFMASGQLHLCGLLSDSEVACAYRSHAIVWVHSLREGFGRCVVEGRLTGARVLASDIAEFAELRDSDVYLYNNPAVFLAELGRLARMTGPVHPTPAIPIASCCAARSRPRCALQQPEAQPDRRKPYKSAKAQRAEHRRGSEILDPANLDVPIARDVVGKLLYRRVQEFDGEHREQRADHRHIPADPRREKNAKRNCDHQQNRLLADRCLVHQAIAEPTQCVEEGVVKPLHVGFRVRDSREDTNYLTDSGTRGRAPSHGMISAIVTINDYTESRLPSAAVRYPLARRPSRSLNGAGPRGAGLSGRPELGLRIWLDAQPRAH